MKSEEDWPNWSDEDWLLYGLQDRDFDNLGNIQGTNCAPSPIGDLFNRYLVEPAIVP